MNVVLDRFSMRMCFRWDLYFCSYIECLISFELSDKKKLHSYYIYLDKFSWDFITLLIKIVSVSAVILYFTKIFGLFVTQFVNSFWVFFSFAFHAVVWILAIKGDMQFEVSFRTNEKMVCAKKNKSFSKINFFKPFKRESFRKVINRLVLICFGDEYFFRPTISSCLETLGQICHENHTITRFLFNHYRIRFVQLKYYVRNKVVR